MGLERFLLLSAVLFAIGLYGALSRRNIIVVLMSIEVMLNAANVALVAFSRYVVPALSRGPAVADSDANANALLTGQTFVAFVVVMAAAEVALGLALVIAYLQHRDTVDVSDMSLLRR